MCHLFYTLRMDLFFRVAKCFVAKYDAKVIFSFGDPRWTSKEKGERLAFLGGPPAGNSQEELRALSG